MNYRILGRTGLKVSALGFGCMRFLTKRGGSTWGKFVDRETAMTLLHRARDLGVNYFDTAYNYHAGASEGILGEFLREVPRDSLLVATKSPVWKVKRPGDFRRLFNVQLKRLGTDRVDLYLLHALNERSFAAALEQGVLDFLQKEKLNGRIGFAGFSFHDRAGAFAPILDAYDWDFCQLQYNIVDTEEQAGRAGLMLAAEKGLGIVVMEPLRGGNLVRGLPESVCKAWKLSEGETMARTCLRWVWDHSQVSTLLSGMSTIEQLEENAGIAESAIPGCLSDDERETVDRVVEAYTDLHQVGCTLCGYCLPCPEGVLIPRIFGLYNESRMFPESGLPRMSYNQWLKPEQRADRCTGCGQCEERCPQSIPIREKLREAHSALSAGESTGAGT